MKIQNYEYLIPAGESRKIPGKGRFIRGYSGSLPYRLRLTTEDGTNQLTDFQTGLAFESDGIFSQVEIENTAAVDQVIGVYVAMGKVDDSRLTGQVDISGGIKLGANPVVNAGNGAVVGSAVKILDASTDRASVLIRNTGIFDLQVGVDAASASAVAGVNLSPGSYGVFTWGSEIWVNSLAGSYAYFEEALA